MRILEVGEHCLFKRAFSEQTDLLWTDRKPPAFVGAGDYADCTPAALLSALRKGRAGEYDVVIVYPTLAAPWHPRFWLRSLAADPSHPYRAATRVFGAWLLGFARLRIPLAVLDIHDDFQIAGSSFRLLERSTLYFKRELPADRWLTLHGSAHPRQPTSRVRDDPQWQRRLAKLRPMALSAPAVHLDSSEAFPEKHADIFFAGSTANSTVRSLGLPELRALAAEGVKVDIPDRRLPQSEFHRRMSEAWLTWSPSGRGWECYRHMEAPQCLSVPVINYPTICRHAPLQQDVHAFYYPIEAGGLRTAVLAALSDKQRLRRMAIEGRRHVLAHHTLRAHCLAILQQLGLSMDGHAGNRTPG